MDCAIHPVNRETVKGFLHTPAIPSGDCVVLAHGAGGDAKSRLLVVVARGTLRRRLLRPAVRPPIPPNQTSRATDARAQRP